MDYQPIEPVAAYEARYEAASTQALAGFSKFTNPFASANEKPLLSGENAFRAVSNLALMGQGEMLQSAGGMAIDATVEIKDRISSAKVEKIEEQSLSNKDLYNDKAQINAIKGLGDYIKDPENKAKFEKSMKATEDCMNNYGYVRTEDPSQSLNKEVDSKFFNDKRIADGISSVTSAAVTVGTGFLGGVAGGMLIDNQKEKIVNANREEAYVKKTDEIYGSCRTFESEGVLTDAKGNVIEITKNRGIDESTVEKVKADSVEGKGILERNGPKLSDKQAKIFDNMEMDSQLSNTRSQDYTSKMRNSYSYS